MEKNVQGSAEIKKSGGKSLRTKRKEEEKITSANNNYFYNKKIIKGEGEEGRGRLQEKKEINLGTKLISGEKCVGLRSLKKNVGEKFANKVPANKK